MQGYQFERIYSVMEKEFGKIKKGKKRGIACCFSQWRATF
jgi:hypothetical protein